MRRTIKKIIYGLFYLIVFFLFLRPFLKVPFEQTPSCFDNQLNQGEAGVDCGGPCVPCSIKQLEPLRVSTPQFFSLSSGRAVVFADIQNPNSEYGASRFGYTFNFFDINNRLLETISEEDSIYGGEKRYVFSAAVNSPGKLIKYAEVKIGDIEWRPVAEIIRPSLSLRGNPLTEVSTSTIRVKGTLINQSSLSAQKIKIIAVLRGKFGENLFASQTAIESLPAFGELSFTVVFPFDKELAEKTFVSATQVFISSR